ncbi:alpha-tocopherol transfer protein-like [Macrosteles quadrilineatus]|uniref:alpha-tocopherol transfer protein-like n=1 Tax=Macrosteles quadrilineatus TaxID=74068 RepID=UPI0023E33F36|nr:alpha-tocopherol transfer protein-like [Macrosteles quadrilineatus]
MEVKCIHMGEYTLKFEDGPELGESFEQRALQELRETPERKEEALEKLRDLLRNEEDLVVPLDNETFLLSYLRPCKFYPESAFERICKFYKFRPKHPKYFGNLVPSNDKNVFQNCLLTVLPHRDQHGSRILMVEAGDKWKPKDCSLVELLRGILMILEAAILEPRTQISGAIVLVDLQGLSLHHVWQFSPGFASMLVEWVQDLIPCRIKAIHIVNQPYIFNMLFNIFKPFLREKLRNRIHFHGEDRSSLLSHIDSKFVPTQYGGDMYLPSDQGIELHRLLSLYEDKYRKTSEYGYITKQKGKKR